MTWKCIWCGEPVKLVEEHWEHETSSSTCALEGEYRYITAVPDVREGTG